MRYLRCRFWMSSDLFIHIWNILKQLDRSFEQRRNCTWLLGHSVEQNVIVALRLMIYGVPIYYIDDDLTMWESTLIFFVKQLSKVLVEVFVLRYLRAPMLRTKWAFWCWKNLPDMLGYIDCMRWSWKNCPATLHEQFKGQKTDATIILKVMDDQETWIWHAYFEMHVSCNNINMLNWPHLFAKLANGEPPPVNFQANGCTYNFGYYLADVIYSKWATSVKPFSSP